MSATQPATQPLFTVDQWINIAIAIGTIGVVFVALFQDWIRGLIHRPRLSIEVKSTPPHCYSELEARKVPKLEDDGTERVRRFFLRIIIRNTGNVRAKNVQVSAIALRIHKAKETNDGETVEPVQDFLTGLLPWTYPGEELAGDSLLPDGKLIEPDSSGDINPSESYGHVYLAWTRQILLERKPNIGFLIPTLPFTGLMRNYYRPGKYQIDLVVTASNAPKPITATILIHCNGYCGKPDEIMFREYFSMEIL